MNNSKILALKYRPQEFKDLIGQEVIAQTIVNAIKLGKTPNAYLLTGIRGIGKTTTARLIAKALNCIKNSDSSKKCSPESFCDTCKEIVSSNHIDVLEMDAASKTGIDDVRELIENSKYSPTSASFKIFIIDEVHMLSKQAFNALLKTLEEPPDNVIFILATTESHKIPPTILSRCQRYDFARITAEVIFDRLAKICKTEQFDVEPDALSLISNLSNGALRDAINILEQSVVSDDPPISETNVRKLMDIGDEMISVELTKFLLEKNIAKALETVNTAANSGTDLRYIHMGLIKYLRAVLLVKSNINIKSSYSEEMYKVIESISQNSELDSILN